MFDSRLKYGFLTTYEHTIFLRKEEFGRAWGLEYSPVIYHSDRGSTSGRTVSFCQSLYHIGLLALADSNFDSSTGMGTRSGRLPYKRPLSCHRIQHNKRTNKQSCFLFSYHCQREVSLSQSLSRSSVEGSGLARSKCAIQLAPNIIGCSGLPAFSKGPIK